MTKTEEKIQQTIKALDKVKTTRKNTRERFNEILENSNLGEYEKNELKNLLAMMYNVGKNICSLGSEYGELVIKSLHESD